jgi:hypothetical protein
MEYLHLLGAPNIVVERKMMGWFVGTFHVRLGSADTCLPVEKKKLQNYNNNIACRAELEGIGIKNGIENPK